MPDETDLMEGGKQEQDGALLPARCNFCSKLQEEVLFMISGPGAYICDECVGICHGIVWDKLVERKRGETDDDRAQAV